MRSLGRSDYMAARSFMVWPIFLIASVCLMIIPIRQLEGVYYVFFMCLVILVGFIRFTRDTKERYLWLIVFIPMDRYFKKTMGIHVSPYDVMSIMVFAELLLTRGITVFCRGFEKWAVLSLCVAVLFSSLLSPIGVFQLGLIARIYVQLFLFIYGLQLFDCGDDIRDLFKALVLMLPLFLFSDLAAFASVLGDYASIAQESSMGAYTTYMKHQDEHLNYFQTAKSQNLINYMIISVPCMFLYMFMRKRAVIILLMAAVFVISAYMQSQTLYLIMVASFSVLFFMKVRSIGGLAKPVVMLLVLFFVIVFSGTAVDFIKKSKLDMNYYADVADVDTSITHDTANQMRLLTIWSNLQAFVKHPILGLGMGNSTRRGKVLSTIDTMIMAVSPEDGGETESGEDALSAHNTFFRVAPEFGLAGLLPFLYLLYYYAKVLFRKRTGEDDASKRNSLILKFIFVGTIFYMMSHDIFNSPRLWMVLMVIGVWVKIQRGTSANNEECADRQSALQGA